jgi:phosphatidylcholine synthase
LTFLPLRWVHPLRVVELRGLTIAVTALWAIVSVAAVLRGFPAEAWVCAVLLAVLAYWLGLTAFWAIRRA